MAAIVRHLQTDPEGPSRIRESIRRARLISLPFAKTMARLWRLRRRQLRERAAAAALLAGSHRGCPID